MPNIDLVPTISVEAPKRRPVRGVFSVLWDRLADADKCARLVPAVAGTTTVTTGLAMAGTPLPAFGVAAAATAGLACLARNRITGLTGLAYAAATVGYAGSWAATIASHAAVSWSGPGDAYLLGGAALLAVPYAYKARWRYEAAELPELVPLEEVSEFRKTWIDYVDIPGADLTPEWDVPGGKQADIIVPRGKMATEDIIAKIKLIRSAYDVAPTQCTVEPTPDARATRARLTVLERDELANAPRWTGPTLDPDTGMCVVGNFPDGAPTHFQFWAPGSGATHSLIAGAPGSGKSRFLDKLLCEAHLSPLIVAWIIDPQEGQSLPDWSESVDRIGVGSEGNLEPCIKVLRAAERVMIRRAAHLGHLAWIDDKGRARTGKKHFDPTPEMPLLYLFIDEAPMLLKDPVYGPEAVGILGRMGKQARKDGQGIALVSQDPSVDEFGGSKASVIRKMLREGNVVSFRTGDSQNRHMMGLKGDPSKIPARFADGSKTHGLGLINGADARETLFRGEYVEEPYDVACLPAAGLLDAMSAEAAEAPDDADRAPKHFVVPGVPRPTIALVPSAADRQTWAERILPILADGAPHSFGAIYKAFPEGTSDRSVRYGLKTLVGEHLVRTAGDKKPYFITDKGRAALEQRSAVA